MIMRRGARLEVEESIRIVSVPETLMATNVFEAAALSLREMLDVKAMRKSQMVESEGEGKAKGRAV
jgi:hypothetical protein